MMGIYQAVCQCVMTTDKEMGFVDGRNIEAESEQEAGEIYEKILLNEGKKSRYDKGYLICEMKVYSKFDVEIK